MAGGITRVNGKLIAPKSFAGVALKDFTLKFWAGEAAATIEADRDTVNGALDQIFRVAIPTVGTVSRVGTVSTASQAYVRFALEVLGDETVSPGKLGMGTSNGTAGSDPTSIALALQAAVQALGVVTITLPNTSTTAAITLTSATVEAFVY